VTVLLCLPVASEGVFMASNQTPTSPPASDEASVLTEDTCPLCGGELSRSSGYAADHRVENVYICTACSLGELSQIELTGNQIAGSVEKKLAHARAGLEKGLLLSRIGGFITADAPDGEYEIKRAGEHTFVINLAEPTADYTDRLITGLQNAAEFIHAELMDSEVVVTDSRWGSVDDVNQSNTVGTRQNNGVPMTDGGIPIAVSPQSNLDLLLSVQERSHGDDIAPRTKRSLEENMDVSLYEKGGTYEVHSESGNIYQVDLLEESCTCPDWQQRQPEGGCKHLRRVDREVAGGTVPRPDGKLPCGTAVSPN